MVFSDDVDCALQAAAALVNSADDRHPPLDTVADLDAFWSRYGYTGHPAGDAAEVQRVRDLRQPLRRLLLATGDDAVRQVNDILRRCTAVPQLVRHGDSDWHIHAVDADRPFDERILVETAMAMIDVIRADELSRLAVCADDACAAVVVDLSRNRSRRYCSTACGNRNAVAAYRLRQSGAY